MENEATEDEPAIDPAGDFRVIKMDGMFHVVFRPAADPEWFRIIASFHRYERAYQYCDLERVMFYDGESDTYDEEKAGYAAPPIQIDVDKASVEADLPALVRDIWGGASTREGLPEPLPIEDFSDQPDGGEVPESPEEYHKRLIAKQADKPICAECGGARSPGSASLCRKCYTAANHPPLPADVEITLTEKQEAVFKFFVSHANAEKLVNASMKQIAAEAGVKQGSMGMMIESLERKRLIEVVERGGPTSSGVFRVVAPAEAVQ